MKFRNQASQSQVTPFRDTGELFKFLDMAKYSHEKSDIAELERIILERKNIFDHNLITNMIAELSIIVKIICSKYPNIPYPQWITKIIE